MAIAFPEPRRSTRNRQRVAAHGRAREAASRRRLRNQRAAVAALLTVSRPTTATVRIGLTFRWLDARNYMAVRLVPASNLVELVEVLAGVETVVDEAAWTATATAELRVIAQGTRIRVWVDRVQLIDATRDNVLINEPFAGLYAGGTAGAGPAATSWYGEPLDR